jgi:hypothetical protein
MKEKLAVLWEKIKENKGVIIKAGAIVAGAALGALVATAIANAQDDYLATEVELLGLAGQDEEDDEQEEIDSEDETD